jgi:hypothetical protein
VTLDLKPINERAAVYEFARMESGPFNCPVTASESADDVPELIAEVELLRAALDGIRVLHVDSPAGFCPSCFRPQDVSDLDDGLVAHPCPTIQQIQEVTR